jgi:hypothetical protein
MKFVTREEFLKLPAGIVYSIYTPHNIRELRIKDDTIFGMYHTAIDFYSTSLIGNVDCENSDKYFDILEAKQDFKADYDCTERDGMFDKEIEYVIYDKEDVEYLINILTESLNIAY